MALDGTGQLVVFKDTGKVDVLDGLLQESRPSSTTGIAHTRWATHGEPSRVNAHPHTDAYGHFAVVHNGIIENCDALKEILKGKGYTFASDTDTEILAHLIADYWNGSLVKAVAAALKLVVGTYGIAIISDYETGTIVCARKGSPLIVGIGADEYFIASDVAAILQHTKQVIYLGEEELAVLTPAGCQVMTINEVPVERDTEMVTWELDQIEKGGFPHFMLKEIFEQPRTVANAIRGRLLDTDVKLGGLNLTDDELRQFDRVVLCACGTSWHSALVGEYVLEELARYRSVEVEYASEFRYRNPMIDDRTLVIVISQSGQTADTLAALREAKRRGGKVLAISNVVGSTIAREADGGIYIHAGPEIGVASTKAFTGQVVALTLLAIHLGRIRGTLTEDIATELIVELAEIPRKIQQILDAADEIRAIAEPFSDSGNFLYLGRGYNFPVALEGALKLKEISYIHAEGYPAAEMKHGPIALIDDNMPVVFLCTQDGAHDKVLSNLAEVRARHGRIIAVATAGDEPMRARADHVIWIPSTLDALVPLLSVIPLQLLSYYVAVKRGCHVDQPRNLAKSVTVE
jgi:glucosamine--fructose-6-phosphate aminotransferase (isomerizing)